MVKSKVACKIKIGFVYLLRNKRNGKGYVGQHFGLAVEHRWQIHIWSAISGSSCAIHKAIHKYGVESFTAEILWRGPASRLNAAEVRYIKCLNTFADNLDGWGYNLTRGGEGVQGFRHSKKSKLKMSKSAKRHRANPEVRALIRENCAIRWADPKEHEKSSAAQLASWVDPAKRKRASVSAKRRAAKPGEYERRVERSKKAAADHPENSHKHSEFMKLKWLDPIYRAALVAAHTGKRVSLATRKAQSEGGKRAWAEGKFVGRKKNR